MTAARRSHTAESADNSGATGIEALFRMLPAVHELLNPRNTDAGTSEHDEKRLHAIRRVLGRLREEIVRGAHSEGSLQIAIDQLRGAIEEELQRKTPYSLRRVINATGVILHTNLGRAPLSQSAIENMAVVAAGYSNLEFNLEHGERGKRDVHAEAHLLNLFSELTNSDLEQTHRAIVVNNCAAATFLALHTLARGKEVIVSRSELVEIGGGFRIPEILEHSGAVLREVGTTNRTRTTDYGRAITADTGLILRVHQSNFSMEGFVERPRLEDLTELGRRTGVPVFEDQGTGLIRALDLFGSQREPTFTASIAAGCDVIAASGDKLLGGPQCGILMGRRELIERMRMDPLYRALRVDKLVYAALEATLIDYLRGEHGAIPTLRMLQTMEPEIRNRCKWIAAEIESDAMTLEAMGVQSVIGGGTAPLSKLPSYAIALRHARFSAQNLLASLRHLDTPIIGRIDDDRVLLDLRTVEPEFDSYLISSLRLVAEASPATRDTSAL